MESGEEGGGCEVADVKLVVVVGEAVLADLEHVETSVLRASHPTNKLHSSVTVKLNFQEHMDTINFLWYLVIPNGAMFYNTSYPVSRSAADEWTHRISCAVKI
jgi:hypothetical protein